MKKTVVRIKYQGDLNYIGQEEIEGSLVNRGKKRKKKEKKKSNFPSIKKLDITSRKGSK